MDNLSFEFYQFVSNNIPVVVAKQRDDRVGLEIWCKPKGFYSVRNGIVRPYDDDCTHISDDTFQMHFGFAMKSIADTVGFSLFDD